MKIKVLKKCQASGVQLKAGATANVGSDDAFKLVRRGYAELTNGKDAPEIPAAKDHDKEE